MDLRKKALSIICVLSLLLTIALTGCGSAANDNVTETAPTSVSEQTAAESKSVSAKVINIDQYGNVRFDITQIDLEYGDSVDISFSGGYRMKDTPFYPDYYGSIGSAILTDHHANITIGAIGSSFNKTANIEKDETAVITLAEKGKYKKEYEAYDISDGKSLIEGQTEEEFLNAREVTAGQIQADRLFRSATPFEPLLGRVEQLGEYLKEHKINCVLDLTDTEESLGSYTDLPEYTASLISSGKVIPSCIGVDHIEPEAMKTIGKGLTAMANADGPYLIHCNLGRDRTGVICAVLEALCGASYQEIVDDYMLSYDMLHKIDMDPSSLQYKLFKQRIDEQLEAVLEIGMDKLAESDLKAPARDYLSRCGMQDESIEKLINKLTSK